ncbi:MAG: TetR/AcrR family transcriptional regulator [Eubacteriales bacterium]|nr:TetR/AcrR family transcriptional regulator [Eubacteriales bacterium]
MSDMLSHKDDILSLCLQTTCGGGEGKGEDDVPTERFLRLPESKKQLIREAAMLEFARVPYDKASINQIIQNAEISRGSFYTYFEDKEDLLDYVFSDSCQKISQICEQELQENGGDYILMLERLFDHFVVTLNQTRLVMDVARNVLSHQEGTKILGLGIGKGEKSAQKSQEETFEWLYDRIDKNRFRYKNKEDYEALLMMGATALMISLKRFYEEPEQLDSIRRIFKNSLELLKYGAYCSESYHE